MNNNLKRICILGTDARTIALKEMYTYEKNILITDYVHADYIIAAIPFSRDNIKINGEDIDIDELLKLSDIKNKTIISGAISNPIKTKFDLKSIKYYDIFDNEEIAILNAIPTAEGAIYKAIEMTDITICNSKVLVMGYGRIGKILSKMLLGIGAKVYVEARKSKDLAEIESMGYTAIDLKNLSEHLNCFKIIFNTIPVKLLNDSLLDVLDKECVIIDLASSPGGIDFEYAKKINLSVDWALALPSKIAPKSAAGYVKQACDKIIKDGNNDS